MKVLLDTNLLVSVVQRTHVHHAIALAATRRIAAGGHARCLVPPNLYEFWAIATRPTSANGMGLTTVAAAAELRRAAQSLALLTDTPAILNTWQALVVRYDVRGRMAHDTRPVAAMLVHRVNAILTFDIADFTRYAGIRVLDPAAVAAGTAP